VVIARGEGRERLTRRREDAKRGVEKGCRKRLTRRRGDAEGAGGKRDEGRGTREEV
jgi:hypothetical protein